MTNYKSMSTRIARAATLEDCDKLEVAMTRVYNAGQLTATELMRLDARLIHHRFALDCLTEGGDA